MLNGSIKLNVQCFLQGRGKNTNTKKHACIHLCDVFCREGVKKTNTKKHAFICATDDVKEKINTWYVDRKEEAEDRIIQMYMI